MALAGVPEGLDFNLAGASQIFLIAGVAILVFIVGFLVMMVVKGIISYNIPVNVWSKTGRSAVFAQDKAKIIRNAITKRPDAIVMQKTKFIEQYPGTDYFHVNEKGKRMLNAFIVDNKIVFFKIEDWMPDESLFSIGWKQSDLHSVFDGVERNKNKYTAKDFWTQHGSLVIGGMVIVSSFVLMIIIVQQMGQFTEALNNAGAAFAAAVENSRGIGG